MATCVRRMYVCMLKGVKERGLEVFTKRLICFYYCVQKLSPHGIWQSIYQRYFPTNPHHFKRVKGRDIKGGVCIAVVTLVKVVICFFIPPFSYFLSFPPNLSFTTNRHLKKGMRGVDTF